MLCEKKMADYMAILEEELLLATGCTEPIAVAYCAAKLRTVLGGKPESIDAEISGNILKNDDVADIQAALVVEIVLGVTHHGLLQQDLTVLFHVDDVGVIVGHPDGGAVGTQLGQQHRLHPADGLRRAGEPGPGRRCRSRRPHRR